MRLWKCFLAAALLTCIILPCCHAASPESRLLEIMRSGQPWQRIHAAEALIRAGRVRTAAAAFQKEAASSAPHTPWRVGCLRVLYAAGCPALRRDAIRRELMHDALDPHSAAHVHALETLGKLKIRVTGKEAAAIRLFLTEPGAAGVYASIVLAQNGETAARRELWRRARAGQPAAVWAFCQLAPLTAAEQRELRQIALDHRHSALIRADAWYSLSCCAPWDQSLTAALRAAYEAEQEVRPKRLLFQALGETARAADRAFFTAFLEDSDSETVITVAGCLLRLDGTKKNDKLNPILRTFELKQN